MSDALDKIVDQTLALAEKVQQIPAPTFAEKLRAGFIQQQMLAEGLLDVHQDELGNVFGRLPGGSLSRPLVVTAHCDTVFPADTPLDLRREADRLYGPGIGDNSLGVAGLFSLVWMLRQAGQQPGDIWLVANVGEEGLGDLRGMRAVVESFGAAVCGYLVVEGMALGQVYHRGLGVQRYRLTVQTPGGHSWVNYGKPSAVHHLARLITQLEALPIPAQPRSSLNVGVVAGGTSVNTIAAEAHLELDLRSENVAMLKDLAAQVETLVRNANRPHEQVVCTAEIIGQRPAGELAPGHPLVRLALRSLQEQGVQAVLAVGSTDANIPLSQGLPAVCVGLTTGAGAHTRNEFVQIAPLRRGLGQLCSLAQGMLRLSSST